MKYLAIVFCLAMLFTSACTTVTKYHNEKFAKKSVADLEVRYTQKPAVDYREIGYVRLNWLGEIFKTIKSVKKKAAKHGADEIILLEPNGHRAIAIVYDSKNGAPMAVPAPEIKEAKEKKKAEAESAEAVKKPETKEITPETPKTEQKEVKTEKEPSK